MKEKIKEIQNSKLEKLNQIIIEKKEDIVQKTQEYFENICEKIIELEEDQTFDFLGQEFCYKHYEHGKSINPEGVKIVQEDIIDVTLEERKITNIGEKERTLLNNILEGTVLVYKYSTKNMDYWCAIYPTLLEELLNEAGLEYDKTYSNSKIITPDHYPIVFKKEKEKTKQFKQRKKKRY